MTTIIMISHDSSVIINPDDDEADDSGCKLAASGRASGDKKTLADSSNAGRKRRRRKVQPELQEEYSNASASSTLSSSGNSSMTQNDLHSGSTSPQQTAGKPAQRSASVKFSSIIVTGVRTDAPKKPHRRVRPSMEAINTIGLPSSLSGYCTLSRKQRQVRTQPQRAAMKTRINLKMENEPSFSIYGDVDQYRDLLLAEGSQRSQPTSLLRHSAALAPFWDEDDSEAEEPLLADLPDQQDSEESQAEEVATSNVNLRTGCHRHPCTSQTERTLQSLPITLPRMRPALRSSARSTSLAALAEDANSQKGPPQSKAKSVLDVAKRGSLSRQLKQLNLAAGSRMILRRHTTYVKATSAADTAASATATMRPPGRHVHSWNKVRWAGKTHFLTLYSGSLFRKRVRVRPPLLARGSLRSLAVAQEVRWGER